MTTSAATSPTPDAGLAWQDGQVIALAAATLPLADDGVLRGDGVFDAMLVRGGRTHARARHLDRLERSAAALDLSIDRDEAERAVTDLLAAWGQRDGAIRLVATRGGRLRGLATAMSWPASIALAVVEAPWRTAISGVKALSYAANQWAYRQARAQGADDALVVDGGRLQELPTGAVVLVDDDGALITPDPDQLPILASISLEVLAEIAPLTRGVPDLADLRAANEVFVVSATRPCLAVHRVLLPDGTSQELPAPGPVTSALRERLDEHLRATLDPD